jgi:protein-S-isoprenylcysteine O-methyltransferase Ste14
MPRRMPPEPGPFGSCRRVGTFVPGNQAATAIARTGPYRFTRNPIYLAFTSLQIGLALLVNSLSVVITLLPAVVLISVVIRREQRYLGLRFPSE